MKRSARADPMKHSARAEKEAMAKKNASEKPAGVDGPGREKPAEKPVKHKESWRDTIESILATSLAMQGNSLNEIMKKLTAWAAIIAIPTGVTGYFG